MTDKQEDEQVTSLRKGNVINKKKLSSNLRDNLRRRKKKASVDDDINVDKST